MKNLTVMLAAMAVTVACGGSESGPVKPPSEATSTGRTQINGAGATFPYPIYSKWFSEYNKLHPTVEINYQSIGSGGGIRQLGERTVFFGASDQPMSDEMLAKASGPILHFPTVLGAVVPIYNIEGLSTQIKFTGPVIADIFLGKIKKWNDPAIVKLNTRRLAAIKRHHRRAQIRRFGHDVRVCRLPVEDLAGMETESGRQLVAELAGRGRGQRQRGCRRPRHPDARLSRVCRAGVCAPEQDQLRRGAKSERRVHRPRCGLGDCRCCRCSADHAERLPRVDHEFARKGRVPHLVVHLDSSCTKIRRTRTRRRS